MIRPCILACLLASWCATATSAETAQQLLEASAAAYARLQTYRDTGTAGADGDNDTVFATAFARPDRLRFAWTKTFFMSKSRSVLLADGQHVTTSRGEDDGKTQVRPEKSLADGVAAATGVSLGAAHTVATLLLPHLRDVEVSGSSVLAIKTPRKLPDEKIEDTDCHHVGGSTAKGDRIDVWVGVSDHLVRRVDTVIKDIVYTEVHRDLRVDEAIAPATFLQADATR